MRNAKSFPKYGFSIPAVGIAGILDRTVNREDGCGGWWQLRNVTCRTRGRAPDPAVRVSRPLSSAATWSREPQIRHHGQVGEKRVFDVVIFEHKG